jgi:cytochrome c-type biogenesis protein CcmH/NrfG
VQSGSGRQYTSDAEEMEGREEDGIIERGRMKVENRTKERSEKETKKARKKEMSGIHWLCYVLTYAVMALVLTLIIVIYFNAL